MSKMIVAADPVMRAKTEMEIVGDDITIRNVQDVEPLIERNKMLLNSGEDGYSPSRTMRRVASIPNVVVHQLIKDGIWDDEKKLSAWLNDPENRFFRTAPGRV